MFDALRRLFRPEPARVRSYDAGASGRRWKGAGAMPSQLSSITLSRQRIAERARYAEANVALARSAVEAIVNAAVGCGIVPQSAHPDPDLRRQINAAWKAWVDEADSDGNLDFYAMQAVATRRMIVDGDSFATFHHNSRQRVPFQVRLHQAEQAVSSLTGPTTDGGLIVNGIEIDAAGRRRAVHMYRDTPGLPFGGAPMETVRIPDSEICLMFKVETPGQQRGISWLAPALLRLADLDQAHDAQIVRQKIAAMLAGFIISADGGTLGFEGESDGSVLEGGLEPGVLKILSPGQDIRFSTPANIGPEVIDFMRLTQREISAALGIPYEILTNDLSQVNYSSIRAGLVEFRRRIESIQHGVIAFQFLRKVWARWLTTAVLSGVIDGRGFERDPAAFLAVDWIPPAFPWVDPAKDIQAEVDAITFGITSRRAVVAARGRNLEELDAEIAADRAREQALGLTFSATAPQRKELPAA